MFFFDQSWMGYGFIGALEAGVISLLVGLVVMLLMHRLTRRSFSHAKQIAWAYIAAMVLSGARDVANLLYFSVVRINSITLLRLKLAAVHDPDSLGLRVMGELAGAAVGVYLGWVLCGGHRKPR